MKLLNLINYNEIILYNYFIMTAFKKTLKNLDMQTILIVVGGCVMIWALYQYMNKKNSANFQPSSFAQVPGASDLDSGSAHVESGGAGANSSDLLPNSGEVSNEIQGLDFMAQLKPQMENKDPQAQCGVNSLREKVAPAQGGGLPAAATANPYQDSFPRQNYLS